VIVLSIDQLRGVIAANQPLGDLILARSSRGARC
jgi:hypothetical protein